MLVPRSQTRIVKVAFIVDTEGGQEIKERVLELRRQHERVRFVAVHALSLDSLVT